MTHNVWAIIPVHGREMLLKYTLRCLNNQTHKLAGIICVGQTWSEEMVCMANGAEFHYHRNDYLGAKWQYALDVARSKGATDILYVGSSDWISSTWVDEMLGYINSGHDAVGAGHWHCVVVYADGTLNFGNWKGYASSLTPGEADQRWGESIGAGRIITKRVLDRLDWQLFDYHMNHNMDYIMQQRVASVGGTFATFNPEDPINPSIGVISIQCPLWGNMHNFYRTIENNTIQRFIPDTVWIEKYYPLLFNFRQDLIDYYDRVDKSKELFRAQQEAKQGTNTTFYEELKK